MYMFPFEHACLWVEHLKVTFFSRFYIETRSFGSEGSVQVPFQKTANRYLQQVADLASYCTSQRICNSDPHAVHLEEDKRISSLAL